MTFACCFPECDKEYSEDAMGWLCLDAQSLRYRHFFFCPEHGEMLLQKYEATVSAQISKQALTR